SYGDWSSDVCSSDLYTDGRIVVWSLTAGKQVADLRSGQTAIRSLAMGTDAWRTGGGGIAGSNWLLAAGDASGTVTVWDVGGKLEIGRASCREGELRG